jgi:hypothetical protein
LKCWTLTKEKIKNEPDARYEMREHKHKENIREEPGTQRQQ